MADAEYMMNNYSAAQNQGCWDDNAYDSYFDSMEFAQEQAKWEEEHERIGKYKFEWIEASFYGRHTCLDETCADYDTHNEIIF